MYSFAGCQGGYLLVFSDTHVDVFNVATGNWIQTINVKKCFPLDTFGALAMCTVNDMLHVIYLCNIHQRTRQTLFYFINMI
jgi:serine/threonine-protein kinase MRCK